MSQPLSNQSQAETIAPRTRGPSRIKTAQTRGLILQAAMAEIMEHGYASSTMARIATRAGLAKGTPYRYFASKEALFLNLLHEVVSDPLAEATALPMLPGETVRNHCLRTLAPMMRIIEETGRATIAQLMLTEARVFPELVAAYRRDVYLPFIEHLQNMVTLAVSSGEIPAQAANLAPHLLVAPLWIGLVQNGILAPDTPIRIDVLFERQVDLIFGEASPESR